MLILPPEEASAWIEEDALMSTLAPLEDSAFRFCTSTSFAEILLPEEAFTSAFLDFPAQSMLVPDEAQHRDRHHR